MSELFHLSDGGELVFTRKLSYDTIPVECDEYVCSTCGELLEQANDYENIGTWAEYYYFKLRKWKPEHGDPRRIYPNYPKVDIK